jgi:formiminotetrahydrofolate cyclodeaminase
MPDYLDGTVREYVARASAAEPTPGGGSVSALAGALAASMGEMVVGYTLGRSKYADVQAEIESLLEGLEDARKALLDLVEKDVEAYGRVDRAMAMPRDSDPQRRARREALNAALRNAMEPPLAAMRHCAAVAEAADRLAEVGNTNLVSDAGVAAVLAEAACVAAGLNVEANLKYIGDPDLTPQVRVEKAALAERCEAARAHALRVVAEKLQN